MKFIKNPANIYTLLWCLYYLQGILYTEGGTLSKGLLVVLMVFSLYCAVTVISKKRAPRFFKGFTPLFLLMSIYGIFKLLFVGDVTILGDVIPSYNALKIVVLSLTPVYAYYLFSEKGYINELWIRSWFFVFFIVVGLCLYKDQVSALQKALEMHSDRTEFTNNSGYLFLALFPAITFFRKKPLFMYLFLILCIGFIIIAMKRGAILIAIISLLYIVMTSFSQSKGRTKFAIITLSILLAIGVVEFVEYFYSSSDYFVARIEQTRNGDASGRQDMFPMYMNYLLNQADFFTLLFGAGADGSWLVFGEVAHNDWFQMAIDYGLLGLLIYLIYWFIIIKNRSSFKGDYLILPYTLFILIEFLKTFFSFSIIQLPIYETCILGYCLWEGKRNIDKRLILDK